MTSAVVKLTFECDAQRLRAIANIGSAISTPDTSPLAPVACANASVVKPGPQPMSKALSPACTPNNAMIFSRCSTTSGVKYTASS